jgi:hypothetical protein
MQPKKMTRRQLAVVAAASLTAAKALAQTPPAAVDYNQAALESHKQNSAVLAAFPLAMSVEPAFQFKA